MPQQTDPNLGLSEMRWWKAVTELLGDIPPRLALVVEADAAGGPAALQLHHADNLAGEIAEGTPVSIVPYLRAVSGLHRIYGVGATKPEAVL